MTSSFEDNDNMILPISWQQNIKRFRLWLTKIKKENEQNRANSMISSF